MFDTMTTTKASAAVIGALLIFLLGSWAADGLYSTDASGHGHEGEHASTGYVIATNTGEQEDVAEEEAVPFADLLAAADPAKGAKVWNKCKACHKLEDGANGTGPTLYGLINRPIGSLAGFGYSDALASHGGDWTPENLNEWLISPKAFAPGNKMSFKGLKKETDRANLISYLQTIGS